MGKSQNPIVVKKLRRQNDNLSSLLRNFRNGGGLDNRFGGDDTKVTGHTQTVTTQNGQFTQTSSHLGDDGKVHFNVQSGKF